jgi:hypothetical protein
MWMAAEYTPNVLHIGGNWLCHYGSVWLVAYGPTWLVVCNFGRFGCLHPVLGLARRVQKAQPSLAAGKRK